LLFLLARNAWHKGRISRGEREKGGRHCCLNKEPRRRGEKNEREKNISFDRLQVEDKTPFFSRRPRNVQNRILHVLRCLLISGRLKGYEKTPAQADKERTTKANKQNEQ
jgi:hypothetical protein